MFNYSFTPAEHRRQVLKEQDERHIIFCFRNIERNISTAAKTGKHEAEVLLPMDTKESDRELIKKELTTAGYSAEAITHGPHCHLKIKW